VSTDAIERIGMFWPGLLLAVYLLATFATMPFFRAYWQDEVQIVDWGRVIAHPESDWAATWDVHDNRPVYLISHLGILLQYHSARIFGGPAGARLSGVVGGLFAFVMILRLLRRLGLGRILVFILGLVFLLDPHFCGSYRGGRVDSWAIGFLLLSALLYVDRYERAPFALLAGASAAVGAMFWPSAVLLLPLPFALAHRRAERPAWGAALRGGMLFGVGLAATLALLLATHPRARIAVDDLLELTQSVTMVDGLSPREWVSSVLYAIEAYRKHVFVMLLSLIAAAHLLWNKRVLLPIGYLLAFLFVGATSPYGNRILYLLPFQVVLLGLSFEILRSALMRTFVGGLLVFLVLWNSVFAVVLRPVEAVRRIEARAPELLDKPFAAAVGAGPWRVFGPWQTYFPGQKLGWRSYCEMRQGTIDEAITRIDFDYAFVDRDDPDTLRIFVQRGYREVPGWTPPLYFGTSFLLLARG